MRSTFLDINVLVSTLSMLALGCGDQAMQEEYQVGQDQKNMPMFELVDAQHSGIEFNNEIVETEKINYFNYMHIYMGAGVAAGDLNNDGLADLYFTGNLVPDRLYLNKGDLKFEDITVSAGVLVNDGFTTGVTFVDIDQDGWLDIYVCRTGWFEDDEIRANKLYINNQNNTFTEKAEAYGLNDNSHSVEAAFFDYDNDGDLDMFLVNNPVDFSLTSEFVDLDNVANDPRLKELKGDDKLYRNDGNGTFTDVSREAGIRFDVAFGLSVSVGDINQDGWPDMFICNDFVQPDFFYINNGDGTFSERSKELLKHTSFFSMGSDLSDLNNDGLLDLVVLDMMAVDNFRQKTMMASMDVESFWKTVDLGYNYQYMHNIFQLNNGNNSFSEIAQLSGIDKTDWSWTPLVADFDNDGFKDIFITNGIKRDVTDKDHIKKINDASKDLGGQLTLDEALELIPSTKLNNLMYKNNGDLTFSDVSFDWGLELPSFSNGAVAVDLDNDGDLDIITNNVDDKAFLFKNNLNETVTTNYLAIKIVGEEGNNHGVGAKIYLNSSLGTQFCEISLNRGYQSSQILPIHFGLGSSKKVDELRVEWPDGRVSLLKDLDANQLLTLDQRDAVEVEQISVTPTEKLFSDITAGSGVNFKHQENVFDDFKKETLLPHKQSQHGAKLAVGDVNGDGLDDFYIGGAAGQTGALYLQQEGKRFKRSSGQPWSKDAASEDIDALFVDTDGDDDLDLYIVSGGNEFESGSPLLNDRLYENDGHGNFTKTTGKLPQVNSSGGCVAAGDFDNDGDADLFVGGRIVPGRYPFPARSYLLQNEGGVFKDVTATKARDLLTPGLVTSAIWSDYNDDGKQDLLVVGEWMPISIFENKGGRLVSVTEEIGFQDQTGWWASIAAADFDGDGDMDYVVGNLGLNSKYKATKEEPLHVYCHDFDDNGTLDIVLGYYNGGDCYPVRGRQCSSEQMPFIKKKFPNYQAFGMATLQDIYGESLENALQHQMARTFASCYIENKGDQGFIITKLPVEAQFSMVQGIIPYDFDEDGKLDLLIAGNLFPAEVETGKHDASIGLFLKGDGKGNFESVRSMNSGFYTPGDVRDLSLLGTGSTPLVVISNNNGNVQIIRINGNMKKQTLAVN